MAQTNNIPVIQVLLHLDNEKVDLNTKGLMTLKFERYIGSHRDQTSNIITELNMTILDTSGYEILGLIQRSSQTLEQSGNIYLQYGFKDSEGGNMSPIYKVTPTRYKSHYDNRGMSLGIGGFGIQATKEFNDAEFYQGGTEIKDIILALAHRNGWTASEDTIKVNGKLPYNLVRKANITDFQFITEKLLPIAEVNTVVTGRQSRLDGYSGFYTAVLQPGGLGSLVLTVLPSGDSTVNTPVWRYTYGIDDQSQIINMTNEIDFDWLVNGIHLKIPLKEDEYIIKEEKLRERYDKKLKSLEKIIHKIFTDNLLNFPSTGDITYKVEFVQAADMEDGETTEEIIVKTIRNLINTINTIELTVVGNPNIKATDLIDLVAVNKEGHSEIVSGFWRVIGITESIGVGGYQTILKLVRHNINVDEEAIKELLSIEEDD